MAQKYIRYMTVPTGEVLPLLGGSTKPEIRPEFKGVKCHLSGLRLFTFKTKGLKCVSCGIEGSFFAIERCPTKGDISSTDFTASPYHLNLYAETVDGTEVLMTHDHILARSLGGRNEIDNTQTMCSPCNAAKSFDEKAEWLKKNRYKKEPMPGQGQSEKAVKRRKKREAARAALESSTQLSLEVNFAV